MGVYYAAICNTCKTSFQLPNIKVPLYKFKLPLDETDIPHEVIPFINWQWKHRDHDIELCNDAGDNDEGWVKVGQYESEK